jgi:uncharacterized protein with HEPN domain
MSEREIKNLLEDILDAANKIINYTKGMSYDDFMEDDKTVDAVVRNFEIIGEASNKIPDNFKAEHPEIEWRRAIGFRNRIIHEYFGIDYENLWRIKNENVPILSEFMKQILDEFND